MIKIHLNLIITTITPHCGQCSFHYYLSLKAKKNMLAIEDMEGGTFSISNGGVFGSLFGTPIINQPQSAILGIHTIKKRPVVVNDQVSD